MAIGLLRKIQHWTLACASVAVLSACGGDGSSSSSSGGGGSSTSGTLSGTAAVGAPIAGGNVSVTCAGGSALTTTTSSSGGWQVTISGQTLPCGVQVSGGTVNGVANTTPYHSIAVTLGTVNITPLTDLITAQVLGAQPQAWFAAPNFSNVNATTVNAALTSVSQALGITASLGNLNPLTSSFTAQTGDPLDKVLESIRAALTTLSTNYSALLQAAVSNNYASFANFGTVYITAFNGGGSSGGGSTGGGSSGGGSTGGNYTLTLDVYLNANLSGPAVSTVVIANLPKPGAQSDFCGEVVSGTGEASIQAQLASLGGSLTVNSCSFNGSVGTVSLTLQLTSPVSMTLPYSARYTYN